MVSWIVPIYIQLFKDNLKPDLDEGEIFQHDRAPCHILHATQQSVADSSVTIFKERPIQRPNLISSGQCEQN